jgi:hypothetical protein
VISLRKATVVGLEKWRKKTMMEQKSLPETELTRKHSLEGTLWDESAIGAYDPLSVEE